MYDVRSFEKCTFKYLLCVECWDTNKIAFVCWYSVINRKMQHIFGLSGEKVKESFVFDLFSSVFFFVCYFHSIHQIRFIQFGFFFVFILYTLIIILFNFIFWCFLLNLFILHKQNTEYKYTNWSGFLSLADSVNKPTEMCAFQNIWSLVAFYLFWIFSGPQFSCSPSKVWNRKSIKRHLLMQISRDK